MGETPATIRTYLTTLKERTGLSWADLSAATKLPDSTIRKIFSGETADPRLETISLIVHALGGSLDEMISGAPEVRDAEKNAVNALRDSYEKRIKELKDAAEQHTDSLKRDKMFLFIVACVLTGFLIIFLIFDLALGSVGWIRY